MVPLDPIFQKMYNQYEYKLMDRGNTYGSSGGNATCSGAFNGRIRGVGVQGAVARKIRLKDMFIVGAWFGIFQAVMPLIGFLLGTTLSRFVQEVDHWIACRTSCAELAETWSARRSAGKRRSFLRRRLTKSMFLPALATSIDALAVGVTFAFLDAPGRDLCGSYRRSNIYDVCGGC